MKQYLLRTICWMSIGVAPSLASAAGADAGVAATNFVKPLQLRICAQKTKHAKIIEAARAKQERETAAMIPWTDVLFESADSNKPIARWTKTAATEKAKREFGSDDYTTRKRPDAAGTATSLEVLVIIGEWDVSSDDVAHASPGLSHIGEPAVFFTMTKEGAERLERLTHAHTPPMNNGDVFTMGIIFNDVLVSAPRIHTTISQSAQITGKFTEEETKEMAAILNSKRSSPAQK